MPAKRLNALQRRYVDVIAEYGQETSATIRRLFFRPGSGVAGQQAIERRTINAIGKSIRLAKLEHGKDSPEAARLKLLFDAQVFAFERRHGEPFKKPRKQRETQ